MRVTNPPVLIVGAGPTGLFLAYALVRQGVAVRIIDQTEGPSPHSRAMGVHARTLEFYRQFSLADGAVAMGIATGDVHFAVDGRERFTFSLKQMGDGHSRYPYLLTLAQDVHERFLIDALSALGVNVEWQTALQHIVQSPAGVRATLSRGGGESQEVTAEWLVGCDGAGSATRHALGIGFGGGTTEGLFYVADVETALSDSDIHVGIGKDTMAVMMPVRTAGTMRLIGIVSDAVAARGDIAFEDVGHEAEQMIGVPIGKVNWFSTYRTHHRVAEAFRVGSCFLAGDAAHIHSPVGGQGMNTGLGDAMNLAWKLAHVMQGRAHAALLDTYEVERSAFARMLVATTDGAFGKMVATGWTARFLRRVVAAPAVWFFTRFAVSKRLIFRTVSQIRINYRMSAISAGRAGVIKGGDRLPWVAEIDNHLPLGSLDWQLHIYGAATPALRQTAAAYRLALHQFAPSRATAAKGLLPHAAYLIRPDGYVGLVMATQDSGSLDDYVADHGLIFADDEGSKAPPDARTT